MILAFTGFIAMFTEMGFASALIQKKDLEERHRSSIFWFNLIAGVVLAGAVVPSSDGRLPIDQHEQHSRTVKIEKK